MEILKKEEYEEKIIEDLLQQNAKNLENRITELEKEISKRTHLNQKIITQLNTRCIQLEERIYRMRYQEFIGQGFRQKRELQTELHQLEKSKFNEQTNCFNDISHLKERLQNAREELEVERQKMSLIK